MTKTYLHFVWVTVFMMACGPAPTPVNPITKKYGDISKVLCAAGDDDGDTVCNDQEKIIPTLGPQCVTNAYCNGTDDSANPEAIKSNPTTIVLAGLAGAALGAGGEAVFHPVENKFNEWFNSNDSVEYTLPDGSLIRVEGNKLLSATTEMKLTKRANGESTFYYQKHATFQKPIRITHGDSTFQGDNGIDVCYVANMIVPNISTANNTAEIQLQIPQTSSIDSSSSPTECFSRNFPGTYVAVNSDKKHIRQSPTLFGFAPQSGSKGGFAQNTAIKFSGLENSSIQGVTAAFVSGNRPGSEFIAVAYQTVSDAWANKSSLDKLYLLVQKDKANFPIEFKLPESEQNTSGEVNTVISVD